MLTREFVQRPPATRAVGGFRVTEGVHAQGSELPWHAHEGPTICFVMQGGFVEGFRGHTLTCEPAMVKFTPAGEPHYNRFDWTGTRGLMVEVDPSRARELRPLAPILDERIHFQGGRAAVLAMRVYHELRHHDSAAPLAVEGLVLELIAESSRSQAPLEGRDLPRFLVRAREILHERLGQGISLSDLAREVEVHSVTLSRTFRRAFGCSVGEYLRRVRLEQATTMLARTDLPLSRIAAQAGFADQSHFANLFRRRTGVTPSRYRRALRSSA